ncbi:unnamed protein product [Soboliphyme baturini]|uniref:Malectin domain-containing protein n=1 Tax=Soboliphyme baturini TaxID=241478 RepID=A0A183IYV8_9BILA|nr:unnamed protein product [Soboliphyme baturini]
MTGSTWRSYDSAAGGREHVDVNGIHYRSDPLQGKAESGYDSDYGRRYLIGRVPQEDQILYHTERYHTSSFEYQLSVPDDGDYVLVLKFSEVYFDAPNKKVFSVAVNDHVVINDLDIHSRVGRAVAYDEHIPFRIEGSTIRILDEVSDYDGVLTVRFIKGDYDNPKVNAMYVMQGELKDVPALPPLEELEETLPDAPEQIELSADNLKWASGPKQTNPYTQQDQSQMFLPILIALACFFPVLFCLCRL